MEIKIGVQNASRELTVDADMDRDELSKQVADAISGGGVLELTDNRGRTVIVPVEKLAYVEIGAGPQGQVGFRG